MKIRGCETSVSVDKQKTTTSSMTKIETSKKCKITTYFKNSTLIIFLLDTIK